MECKSPVVERLCMVDHAALGIGKLEHLGEEGVRASLRAEGSLALTGMEELVGITWFIIDSHIEEVDTRGLGDNSIDHAAEPEGLLAIANDGARVEHLLEGSEVRVRDLTA